MEFSLFPVTVAVESPPCLFNFGQFDVSWDRAKFMMSGKDAFFVMWNEKAISFSSS